MDHSPGSQTLGQRVDLCHSDQSSLALYLTCLGVGVFDLNFAWVFINLWGRAARCSELVLDYSLIFSSLPSSAVKQKHSQTSPAGDQCGKNRGCRKDLGNGSL